MRASWNSIERLDHEVSERDKREFHIRGQELWLLDEIAKLQLHLRVTNANLAAATLALTEQEDIRFRALIRHVVASFGLPRPNVLEVHGPSSTDQELLRGQQSELLWKEEIEQLL